MKWGMRLYLCSAANDYYSEEVNDGRAWKGVATEACKYFRGEFYESQLCPQFADVGLCYNRQYCWPEP